MGRPAGKTALIIGVSKGIARTFVKHGAKAVLAPNL